MTMKPVLVRIFFPAGFSPAFLRWAGGRGARGWPRAGGSLELPAARSMYVDPVATTREAVANLSERIAIEEHTLNGIFRYDNGVRTSARALAARAGPASRGRRQGGWCRTTCS